MTTVTERTSGVLLIVLGASAWGTLGVFATTLYEAGLKPIDVAAARVTVAWIGFAAIAMVSNREPVRLTLRQLGWLALHGLITVALYNLLYFDAIAQIGIALAVALLYSAPAWSAVLGYFLLHERHPSRVYVAVPLTVMGVTLTVTSPTGLGLDLGVPAAGLLSGLGAALTYALFSILGKPLLRNFPPSTLLFYSFGTGGLLLTAVAWLDGGGARLMSLGAAGWLVLLAAGVVPTFLAYLAYTEGLRRTPASLATLLATTEPVVGVALGLVVADERLSVYQFGGIVLVLAAAVIVTVHGQAAKNGATVLEAKSACGKS